MRFLILLLALVLSSPGFAQKDKKDKKEEKKEKEEKFEKTGTSADNFLRSAFDMGQNMKKFNKNYDEVKLFVFMMVSNPQSVVGKDAASVIMAARDAGTVPASIEVSSLETMVKDKAASLKDIKDAVVKNSITEFIKNCNDMNEALIKMAADAPPLISEATGLPDKLKAEMTGLQKAKLPKVLDKVTGAKTDLSNIQAEAPKLASNAVFLAKVMATIASTM